MKLSPISNLTSIFGFPHPVNEYAARSVAGMVMVLAGSIVLFDIPWLLFLLAYGFLARVLTGPKLSPMGIIATKIIAPKILNRNRPVPGPPKRFAQTICLACSVFAILMAYGFSQVGLAYVVVGILIGFAFLESILGFCAGCFVFSYLMKWGLIPADVCERCNNLQFSKPS